MELKLSPGSIVRHKGRDCVVLSAIDLLKVLVLDLTTRKKDSALICDLEPGTIHEEVKTATPALDMIPDSDWKEAQRKFELIRPLLVYPRNCFVDVQRVAEKAGVHPSTIYEWKSLYRATGRVSSLLPNHSNGGKGKPRIDDVIGSLLDATIKDVYLNAKKASIISTIEEFQRRCLIQKLEPCHPNTVRNRIKALSEERVRAAREDADAAENQYGSAAGHFPATDFPLSVVQIDHCRANVIIVDDRYRLPIGRPWVTLAIDVFTRCVPGFYVSLDTPNSVAVGNVLAMTILPKESFIAGRNLSFTCPVYGKPRMVCVSNGREFRSKAVQRACMEHGIILEFRPAKASSFGGHIERLFGTAKTEILTDVDEQDNYDSEKYTRMTLGEYTDWLATMLWGKYHNRIHSEIGMTPLAKFESAVLGDEKHAGIGYMPTRVVDEHRLLLDFLPSFERTVQRHGVEIDGVGYFGSVLRPYINACIPGRCQTKQKFQFKRDPRAISPIWFFDPKSKEYYPIPYRDTSRPVVSSWELETAKRRLNDEGIRSQNETALFRAVEEVQARQESAAQKIKAARLAQQCPHAPEKAETVQDNAWATLPVKPMSIDINLQ